MEAPDDVQKHYPGIREASVYVGEICFLVEPSYRQGVQWVSRFSYPQEGRGILGSSRLTYGNLAVSSCVIRYPRKLIRIRE